MVFIQGLPEKFYAWSAGIISIRVWLKKRKSKSD
jgi:hypothetical protein